MTNYYVKNGGKNSNTGLSDAQAWKTIGQVNNFLFKTGDNVFFKCGGTWEKQMLVVDWSGTADNKVVIGAYYGNGVIGVSGNKPVFDGQYIFPGNLNNLITVYKQDYVTIQDIKLINSNGKGMTVHDGFDVNVFRIDVKKMYSAGIAYIRMNAGIIEGCTITDTGRKKFELPGTNYPASIAVNQGCKYIIIRKNIVHSNYGEGIGSYHQSSNILIEENICYDNKVNIYTDTASDVVIRYNLVYRTDTFYGYKRLGEGRGIAIYDEHSTPAVTMQNYEIYGNLIARCGSGLALSPVEPGSVAKNINFYNNTVVDNEKNWYSYEAVKKGSFVDCKIYNNIFWCISGDCQQVDLKNIGNPNGGLKFDYNLWSSEPDDRAQGPNDPPYALPKLAKTSGWNNLVGGELIPEDFMLQPDSPAIDKGIPIDGITHDFFGTSIPQGSAPDIGAIEYTDVSDPCAGVVCENVCVGLDLWSQKCVDGSCVPDQLIESNSVTCGYDPCAGVVCDNVCFGLDLWSLKCVDGDCVPDQLLESNSVTCGYDPCAGVVCDNVCFGLDLWSLKCVDGDCVPDQLLESNSATCELCEGVVCDNICIGDDLWSQICDPDTGNCVANQLLQQDSINCTIPEKVPSDESTIKTYIILGGFGIMGLAMLILRKK